MKRSKFILYVSNILFLFIVLYISSTVLGKTNSGLDLQVVQGQQGETQHEEWQRLNELASEALTLVRKNDFAAAREQVTQLEEQLLNLELGDYVERLDQANLLTGLVVQAKYALNQVQPDPKNIERRAWQLRLTLDAVSHKQQPLWLNAYPSLSKAIEDLRQTIEQNQREAFYKKLNELENMYQLVRPALFVSHKQGVVEQLDSQVAFLTKNSSERWKNKDQTLNVLQSFEQQLKLAFFQRTNQLQSFIFLLIGFTSIICAVLGYVGWRKYKGERDQKQLSWKQISSKNQNID
ncbi:sporulation protein YpjB [Bacillus horti]|uniref:Sporulation protein YpjB n=1 Tax=Caldalkalibacillus horti TaxID=77523 RepID=A0ABT9VWZ8_9BACI|nr:sporulation protein YpjB [Bacillus horti]MDQ0165494.1 sporulation protein YpjB [Bacillus horti]